uniref:Uncharacterized protein n=1 Tax=Oryza brachyantha TaxID=4533 RepID=J3N100_ORYBR
MPSTGFHNVRDVTIGVEIEVSCSMENLESLMVKTFSVREEISSALMVQSCKERSSSVGQPISSCLKKPSPRITLENKTLLR